MKMLMTLLSVLLMNVQAFSSDTAKFIEKKGPVVIEVYTKHSSEKEVLQKVKTTLLMHKFIIDGSMGESSFTAKRTTGAEADYYVADVMVEKQESRFKTTISFIKIGTGLLKLQKVADKVKTELENN